MDVHQQPPVQAPPAPPEAQRKALTKTLVVLGASFLGCVVLPIVLIAFSIASDNAKESKFNKLIAEASFTSSQEIKGFLAEHEIEYKAQSSGWDAKQSYYDDAVAQLYIRYKELLRAELQAEMIAAAEQRVAEAEQWVRDALADPPKTYSKYQEALRNKLDIVEDEELLALGEAEYERITPLADKERAEKAKAEAEAREARRKAQADAAEKERLRKERESRPEEAREMTATLFRYVNPQATINWATYSSRLTANDKQVYVSFEYSVVNAFGARVQRLYECWWKYDLSDIVKENDEFLYFRK